MDCSKVCFVTTCFYIGKWQFVLHIWHMDGGSMTLTYEWANLFLTMPANCPWLMNRPSCPWHMNWSTCSWHINDSHLSLTYESSNLSLTYEWQQFLLDVYMVVVCLCHMNGGNLTLTYEFGNLFLAEEWWQSDLEIENLQFVCDIWMVAL